MEQASQRLIDMHTFRGKLFFSLEICCLRFSRIWIFQNLLKSVSWFDTCYCLKTAPKVMNNSKLTKEQETFANWTVYFFLPSTFFLLWRTPISFQALSFVVVVIWGLFLIAIQLLLASRENFVNTRIFSYISKCDKVDLFCVSHRNFI